MAWIYLAESAESAWPYHPGCGQSPTVRTTPMLWQFYYPECQPATFRSLQSGTTSRHYIRKTFRQSTPCTEDSRARTLALQELAAAWTASEADSYLNYSALFANWDQS